MTMTQLIPDWFRNTPAGREIEAQAEANARAARQKIGAEIERLERELAEGVPRLDAKIAKAAKGAAEARAAVQTALAAYGAAQSERATFVAPREARANQLRAELRATASPIWDELRDKFTALQEQIRSRPIESEMEESHTFGRTTRRVLATNGPAVRRRLEAIASVLQELELLKESCVADVDATIAALWARVGGRSVESPMEKVA